jgi:hypothetical protein
MQNSDGAYWVSFEISWMGVAVVAVAAAATFFAAWRVLRGIARANRKSN